MKLTFNLVEFDLEHHSNRSFYVFYDKECVHFEHYLVLTFHQLRESKVVETDFLRALDARAQIQI